VESCVICHFREQVHRGCLYSRETPQV